MTNTSTEKNESLKFFMDSDAFIAINFVTDTNHDKSVKILDLLKLKKKIIYTSTNVIMETSTIISQRLGKKKANEFIKNIRSTTYLVIHPNEEIILRAEDTFTKKTSKNTSYSDCISFTIMQSRKIEWAFSFDADFKKAGFKRLGLEGFPK